ncbi:hypothetical protein [Jiangella muralis]|uniref:hypothetical protein n=1 Tax=Jiangella muralis TaxID=702383 RepID=UPI00069F984B|nr:hypothetical protein [Jiangella muralis]
MSAVVDDCGHGFEAGVDLCPSCTAGLPADPRIGLGRAALDLLDILRFRASLGDSWLVEQPRQRFALYVPNMSAVSRPEYLRTVNGATLRALHGRELIEYGPDVSTVPFRLRNRTQLNCDIVGGVRASTVQLTDAGKAAR